MEIRQDLARLVHTKIKRDREGFVYFYGILESQGGEESHEISIILNEHLSDFLHNLMDVFYTGDFDFVDLEEKMCIVHFDDETIIKLEPLSTCESDPKKTFEIDKWVKSINKKEKKGLSKWLSRKK